jgi:hypothetical protein
VRAAVRLQVESVADYRGVETPRRFHLDGRTVEIVESADQWQGADYRYFKVKTCLRTTRWPGRHNNELGAGHTGAFSHVASNGQTNRRVPNNPDSFAAASYRVASNNTNPLSG